MISNISKTYKAFIQSRILEHVDGKEIYKGFQIALNTGKNTVTVSLAFDTACRKDIALKMTKLFNFPHICFNVKNYLENRIFQAKIYKEILSSTQTADQKVPQGSILDSILYNICTKDILIKKLKKMNNNRK